MGGGGGGRGGVGGHVPPPLLLELQRVSQKRCLVPPKYRITNGAPQSQSCFTVPVYENVCEYLEYENYLNLIANI